MTTYVVARARTSCGASREVAPECCTTNRPKNTLLPDGVIVTGFFFAPPMIVKAFIIEVLRDRHRLLLGRYEAHFDDTRMLHRRHNFGDFAIVHGMVGE